MRADSDPVRGAINDDQRLGELLGVVHDLRQPLAAMRFVLSLVPGQVDLPGDVQARLDQLGRHVTWMSELLRLPGTRASLPTELWPLDDAGSDGRGLGRPRAVNLDRVADSAARSAGESRSARLMVEVSGRVPVAVAETELRRALGNLIDNAFRAAGPTGTVRVRVGRHDQVGFVSVDDDGPGFGRVASGSGLGWSLVAQVAASVGGQVEIAGSDLGGASVTLRLPVRRSARVKALV
jgi:signal transduction histidine kinase